MIPIQGTAAVLTAPPAPLQTSGYVPGNTLAAQILNWYLYHLTAELNNVLSGQGLSQSTGDDSQLLKAIGRTNVLIASSGTVTTAAQFSGNTLVQFANLSGSSNYVIGSGAARPGVELIVEALAGSGVMLVNGSGSAFLGSGAVRLLWDGSQWCKIGGNAFLQVFTSGSGVSWFAPWKGSYKATVVGGGGGGGGIVAGLVGSAGSGASGGTVVGYLAESALAVLTLTVGAAGSGYASGTGAGSSGTNSILSDGTNTLTAGGGTGGAQGASGAVNAVAGGTATGGSINISGQSFPSVSSAPTGQSFSISGDGGSTMLGSGGPGVAGNSGTGTAGQNGNNGSGYGSGGSGAANTTNVTNRNGGNGAPGVIVLEF